MQFEFAFSYSPILLIFYCLTTIKPKKTPKAIFWIGATAMAYLIIMIAVLPVFSI
jgi:hypothetical protein